MHRQLGTTGITVSALGYGAAEAIGDASLSESEAGTLLNAAVDLGITLIDTARSYGLAEERIGRHLSWRRSDIVLSTKVGYGVEGAEDWTGPCISAGINRALRVMQTDVIDIVHLHSCPLEVLQRDDILGALDAARSEGKIRVAAYSGDNEPADWAVRSGRFGCVQTSISVVDQRAIDAIAGVAEPQGIGVIAKRPLANAVWRHGDRPSDWAERLYWDRWKAMALQLDDPVDTSLRFAAFSAGVSAAIIGSRSPDHLRANVASIERGPLAPDVYDAIRRRWTSEWRGVI